MKNIIYILLSLSALFNTDVCSAQNISVSSFSLLEKDLTAITSGTSETDQNGETAALIKIETPESGFIFDGGMLGIVKTKQTQGEIWLYVPKKIQKLSIKHPELGVLRDYYFPTIIESGKTYKMVLNTIETEELKTKKEIEALDELIKSQNDEISLMETQFNTAFVAIGTNKELRKWGILNESNSSNKKSENHSDKKQHFKKIDIRTTNSIYLGKNVIAKISSSKYFEKESYRITKEKDGLVFLYIDKPDIFWSYKKTLIIEIAKSKE